MDSTQDAHPIGFKLYVRGEEAMVISAPYILHGGEFQDVRTSSGLAVVPSPKQRRLDLERANQDRKTMQAGFRRLRELR